MKKKGIKELLSKLLPYVRPHKTVFFLSVIFDIIAIALNMTIPIFSGLAIDCMVGIANVNFHLLIEYLVIIIILSAFSSFFSWLGEYYMNILTYKTGESIRNALYNKINNVPIKYIDNHSHGDIMNTMSADVENVTDGFLSGYKAIVCGVFQLLVIMVIMFVMRWTLALIVIVIAPLSLVLAIMITKKSKRLYKQRVEVQGDLSGFAEEMMTNMKIIKAFNDEKNTVEKFNTYNKKMYTASEKSVFYASLANPASRLVNGILYGVIGAIGAFMVMNGTIKIGRVSSFLSYSDNFTKPFNDLTSIFADLNIAIASATRVFEMLEEENEINDSKLPNLKKCDGTVDLKDVEFS